MQNRSVLDQTCQVTAADFVMKAVQDQEVFTMFPTRARSGLKSSHILFESRTSNSQAGGNLDAGVVHIVVCIIDVKHLLLCACTVNMC